MTSTANIHDSVVNFHLEPHGGDGLHSKAPGWVKIYFLLVSKNTSSNSPQQGHLFLSL